MSIMVLYVAILLCFLAAIDARSRYLPSQCNMSSNYIGCPYNTFNLTYEYGERSVYWQVRIMLRVLFAQVVGPYGETPNWWLACGDFLSRFA